jgi:hypothetical protein
VGMYSKYVVTAMCTLFVLDAVDDLDVFSKWDRDQTSSFNDASAFSWNVIFEASFVRLDPTARHNQLTPYFIQSSYLIGSHYEPPYDSTDRCWMMA